MQPRRFQVSVRLFQHQHRVRNRRLNQRKLQRLLSPSRMNETSRNESVEPLKPGFSLAPSPSLMPVIYQKLRLRLRHPNPPNYLLLFLLTNRPKKQQLLHLQPRLKTYSMLGASSTTPSIAESAGCYIYWVYTLGSSNWPTLAIRN